MKIKRHSKIIELIGGVDIETQEELAELLCESGFEVTQATVSRDIHDLRLTKVPGKDGRQKYAMLAPDAALVTDRLISVFRSGVMSVDHAANIVVIKTLPGLAMGAASSLDKMGHSEAMGSIAGDDVIICVTRTEDTALSLVKKLNDILREDTYD